MPNLTYGSDRVAMEMRLKGIWISASGVESIWKRHKMLNKKMRIKKLEEKMKKEGIILSEK